MKLGTIGELILVVIMGCIIAGTVIAFSFGQEPETGKWRWAEDTLQPNEDKQLHALRSFG